MASRRPPKTKPKRAPRKRRAPKKPSPSPHAKVRQEDLARWLRRELITSILAVAVGVLAACSLLYAEALVRVEQWANTPPSSSLTHVYSAPIVWRVGEPADLASMTNDLLAAGYEQGRGTPRSSTFTRSGQQLMVWTPETDATWGNLQSRRVTVTVDEGQITAIEPGDEVALGPTLLGRDGDVAEHRQPLRLERLSPWVVPALLAIEDNRFRTHVGVDPIGIGRALINNLRGNELHGGSTLTQQLAKNTFLSQERTIQRKIHEVFYTAALELTLDKDELLEAYLREVYLGHSDGVPIYGVEAAARSWFGTSSEHLSLSQAATIAGTIAAPNAYSPLRHPEAALERRNVVLNRMVWVHAIDEATADLARDAAIHIVASDVRRQTRSAWAVDAALDALSEQHPRNAERGGVNVYSTIQPHLQRAAERVVTTTLDARGDDAQAALVTLDAITGDVLVNVGGRDARRGNFNRAQTALRQPGSTIKPLTVLLALANDPTLTPISTLEDTPLTIRHQGTEWRPENADHQHHPTVPLRDVVVHSRNLPAVRLAEGLGWANLGTALRSMGLEGATDLPAISLGAFPATPLQVAQAYTAIAGNGTVHPARLIRAAERRDGTPLPLRHSEGVTFGDATLTALIRDMMRSVSTQGTARDVGLPPHVAVKTGTTDEGRDAWMVALEGRRVHVVWVGRDRGVLGSTGAKAAGPVMAAWLRQLPTVQEAPPVPTGVSRVTMCATDGRPACPDCEDPIEIWMRSSDDAAPLCSRDRIEKGDVERRGLLESLFRPRGDREKNKRP
ncbi:MAG: transglycosylase domain-containing protein [Myxococcota bacterium]